MHHNLAYQRPKKSHVDSDIVSIVIAEIDA